MKTLLEMTGPELWTLMERYDSIIRAQEDRLAAMRKSKPSYRRHDAQCTTLFNDIMRNRAFRYAMDCELSGRGA